MSSCARGGRRAPASAILATAILLLSAGPAAAPQDVVYLKPSSAGGAARRLTGRIVDYTGRELRMLGAGGRERSIPAEQVERIATARRAEQLAGDKALARGEFLQALDLYRQALAAAREPRDWVRREILSQIVRCQQNLGQYDQAGEYFRILLSRDPDTPYFDCIPLVWSDQQPSAAVVQKAQVWIAGENSPATALMGASQLLSTDQRAAAVKRLKQLASDPDSRIAWLAQAQLWRAAAPTASVEQLHAWSEAIESRDESLRAGAYFVVGSALARRDAEEAALLLMKLPILYPREYALSAAALLAAGECLEKRNRAAQAAALYRELAGKYDQAPEAAEARRRLERLASTVPARDN
jgi:tetratricopeptide (TPR) repeat protein